MIVFVGSVFGFVIRLFGRLFGLGRIVGGFFNRLRFGIVGLGIGRIVGLVVSHFLIRCIGISISGLDCIVNRIGRMRLVRFGVGIRFAIVVRIITFIGVVRFVGFSGIVRFNWIGGFDRLVLSISISISISGIIMYFTGGISHVGGIRISDTRIGSIAILGNTEGFVGLLSQSREIRLQFVRGNNRSLFANGHIVIIRGSTGCISHQITSGRIDYRRLLNAAARLLMLPVSASRMDTSSTGSSAC